MWVITNHLSMERNTLTVPVAIILAGALIGGAVIFSNMRAPKTPTTDAPQAAEKVAPDISIRPVSASDFIVGNPDAPALLVEYSDTECPFCKIFHTTLNRFVDEYGKDGKFAWVYRHFPLQVLHERAHKEAEATECAAELGGNAKFWEFTNRLYSVTSSNDSLDPAELPKIAQYVGLNVSDFNACLSSGRTASKVEEDYQEAVKAGGQGTPFSIFLLKSAPSQELRALITNMNAEFLKRQQYGSPDVIGFSKDERKLFVSGALPYEMLKGVIDVLVK